MLRGLNLDSKIFEKKMSALYNNNNNTNREKKHGPKFWPRWPNKAIIALSPFCVLCGIIFPPFYRPVWGIQIQMTDSIPPKKKDDTFIFMHLLQTSIFVFPSTTETVHTMLILRVHAHHDHIHALATN